MRDYTCVVTTELARAFHRSRDKSVSLADYAERLGMDIRDFKRIVEEARYKTTSLGLADRVLLSAGANITALDLAGVLTVIPMSGEANARLMAEDEWAAGRGEPRIETRNSFVERRTAELVQLRKDVLARNAA